MLSQRSLTFLLVAFIVALKYEHVESIYCYECNSNWAACAQPPNLSVISSNQVPCTGSCYTYTGPDGTCYRGCTMGSAIEASGGQTGLVTGSNGLVYQLCTTNLCNTYSCPAGAGSVTTTIASVVVATTAAASGAVQAAGYCYECNSNWWACTPPVDLATIAQNKVPCTGSCYTYLGADGICYRGCTTGTVVEASGGTSGTVVSSTGLTYTLCNTALCNTGACSAGGATTAAPIVVTTAAPIVVTTAPVVVVTTTPSANCLTTCLNGGTLQGCTCTCFPPYSGADCSIVDCTKDDPACTGMDCSFAIVQNLCPNYCHIAACPATTTAPAATTTIAVATTTTAAAITTTGTTTITVAPITTDTTTTTTDTTTTVATTDTTTIPCTNVCLNGGTLNADCTCTCYAPYQGAADCSIVDCTKDDPSCSSLSCTIAIVSTLCPNFCGNAACLTTTAPVVTTTTMDTTTATTAACTDQAVCATFTLTLTDCLSQLTLSLCPATCAGQCGGLITTTLAPTTTTTTTPTTTVTTTTATVDNAICASFTLTATDCLSKMTMSLCPVSCAALLSLTTTTAATTTPFCTDQAVCASYSLTATDCLSQLTLAMCPATCAGQCGGLNTATTIAVTTPTTTTTDTTAASTTTDTTTLTTTQCTLTCQYAFIADASTCTCMCNAAMGFSGPTCGIVDCTIAVDQDPTYCKIVGCADPQEQQSCPWSCGLCSSTTAPTTTTASTTTACVDPGCAYGFYWDATLCTCSCNKDTTTAFSGQLCNIVDCTKAADDTSGFCAVSSCIDPIELQTCPFACRVCPTSG